DIQIGDATGVLLSDGTSGFMDYHQIVEHSFNEARDYYYPIPTKERELNPKLKQNPGWLDGLDY
ncbi:MAG: RagB/SusD family nutrient uptake outer membrane protein, partial [Bacteroidales bacterium]|nr:RagB/SusD family nutrient uptake outer membrane protein [Bacteroidales bacterium]